jgi:anti-sigma factor RsiW
MIASYLDAAVDSSSRSRLESHFADCEYCRALVAELAKVQRDDEMPSLPHGLLQRAVALVPPSVTSPRWLWAPAWAMVGTAILLITVFVVRSPERLRIPSASGPAAPVIAKLKPAPTLHSPVHEIVRKPPAADVLLSVVSPHPGSIVARERLKFEWKVIPHSLYYQVHVATSEGDPVWEGQSEGSVLRPPADITFSDGPYFVWITAYLEDGREAKSAPIKFSLALSR